MRNFIKLIFLILCFNSCLESSHNAALLEDDDVSVEKDFLIPGESDPKFCESKDQNDDHFYLSKVSWKAHHVDKNFQIYRKPISNKKLEKYISSSMTKYANTNSRIAEYRKISKQNPTFFRKKKYTSKESYIKDFSLALSRSINAASQCFGIDPFFLTALIQQESLFSLRAQSPTGAVGLTQFTTQAIREVTWHTREVKNKLVEASIKNKGAYSRDDIIYNYNRKSSSEANKALTQNLFKTVKLNEQAKSCMELKLGKRFPLLIEKLQKHRTRKEKPYLSGYDEKQASNSQFSRDIGYKLKNILKNNLLPAVYYGASFFNFQISKACFNYDLTNNFPEKDPRSCSSLFLQLNRCDKDNLSGEVKNKIIIKALRAYNGASQAEQRQYYKKIISFAETIYDSI